MKFRGYIFTLKDLNNIKSALDIKDNFSFAVDIYFIALIIVTIMIGYIILISHYKHSKVKYKIVSCLTGLCLSVIFVLLADYKWTHQKVYPTFGAGPWTGISEIKMSSTIGTYLSIYYDTKFNVLVKPDNYNIDIAKSYIENYKTQDYNNDNVLIIGILSESYADLTRYLQLDIEPDCYEYWNNLKENVIKGYVNVSPYGGMTCNSEFEFLTGNSMYFLPEGSAAFTTYLFPDTSQDGLVSYLNDLGFNTTSYCPFSRELWNADMAYTNLGFKTKMFAKEIGIDNTNVISHPSGYLSDRQLFEKLINYIEDHKTSKDFYWVTTQQNHNPYDYINDSGIDVLNSNSQELKSYLNNIKDTNEAFKYLIDYFKDYDKKVYIVIFGDHYPEITDIDVPYISSDEDEAYRLCHQTPYMIWTNQNIEYQEKDTSLNYLANDLCNVANIPLSKTQQYQHH